MSYETAHFSIRIRRTSRLNFTSYSASSEQNGFDFDCSRIILRRLHYFADFWGKRAKEKSLKCLIFSDFLNFVIFTCGPTWAWTKDSLIMSRWKAWFWTKPYETLLIRYSLNIRYLQIQNELYNFVWDHLKLASCVQNVFKSYLLNTLPDCFIGSGRSDKNLNTTLNTSIWIRLSSATNHGDSQGRRCISFSLLIIGINSTQANLCRWQFV